MNTMQDTDRYYAKLFEYVRLVVDIPPEDQALCRQYFKPRQLKKGTLLAKAGTIHRHHNFIVSGFMRNFHVDEKGEEVTTDLNDGPRFFTSYTHFAQRTVSPDNLHCITDCEILQIDRDDVDITAQLGITQLEYSLKILEQQLEKDKQRAIALTTLTAEQRYLELLAESPSIIQNVPLKYVASYLGINPGSLSRIRKAIG